MSLLGAGAGVLEDAVDHIARREHHLRPARRILRELHRTCAPVAHTPEHRRHVLQQLVGLAARLQHDVAGKARLGAAPPIGHQRIAILRYLVKPPLVYQRRVDVAAQAVARVGAQVVKHPSRVIRPGDGKCTIPHPRVGACVGVVVAGHLDPQAQHVVGPVRYTVELLGAYPKAMHHTVRVAQLHLLDLGVRVPIKNVHGGHIRCHGRDAPHPYIPGRCARQVQHHRPLVTAHGFAGDGGAVLLQIAAAIALYINGKFHTGTRDIAIGNIGLAQLRQADRHTHLVGGHGADTAHQRRGDQHGHPHCNLILHRLKTGQSRLPLGATGRGKTHPFKIHCAIGILQSHLVQVHAFQAVHQALHLAFAYEVQDLGILHTLEVVCRLGRRVATATAFATTIAHNLHSFTPLRCRYHRY